MIIKRVRSDMLKNNNRVTETIAWLLIAMNTICIWLENIPECCGILHRSFGMKNLFCGRNILSKTERVRIGGIHLTEKDPIEQFKQGKFKWQLALEKEILRFGAQLNMTNNASQ